MAIDLNDKTSNANNLTNHSATEYTATHPFAESTEAVEVDGTPLYLTAPDSAPNSFTNNFTMECSIRWTTLPVGDVSGILEKTDSGQEAWSFFYSTVTGLSMRTFPLSGSAVAWSPSTNTWYHVAMTFASNQVKFYVDGSQQGTTQTNGNSSVSDTTSLLRIGPEGVSGTTGTFQMTNIRIWNVVRTVTEINDNKAALSTGSESNLVAYYPFQSLAGGGSNGSFFAMI